MAVATKTIRVKFRPDNGRIIGTPLNQWKIAFVAKKYRGRVCLIHEQTCVVCHETMADQDGKGCFIVWPPTKCEQCEHEETYAMCVRLLDRAITKLLLFVGPPDEPLPEIDPFVAGSVVERGNAISQWLRPYEELADKSPLALDILEQMGKARFSGPVSEIPWSWNYRGFCIDKSVAVEWVEQSSTHMEYIYGRIAYPVLMRWRAQGEIKIADEQLGLVAAKFAELKETERLWREQKDRWVMRLASPPPVPEAEPT